MIYVEFTMSGSAIYEVEPEELIEQYPELANMESEDLAQWVNDNIYGNDGLWDFIVDGNAEVDHDVSEFQLAWSDR